MRYYSTQRPVGPGTFPKPKDNRVLDLWNFDKPIFCEQVGREAWGYINYEKPLTQQQTASYELAPEISPLTPAQERIAEIIMQRDNVFRHEAEYTVRDCRQRLAVEAVPSGDSELAEEILAEDLGLEPDYLMDMIL